MSSEARKDRDRRLVQHLGGAWRSYSQDYVRLCILLYEKSRAYATEYDGNVSPYTLSGIPGLFSGLRALMIECSSGMYGPPLENDTKVLRSLASNNNEIVVLKLYEMAELKYESLRLLYEVRNEIVHPAHRPVGTVDGTPEYLRPLKSEGLLQTSGKPDSDYALMAQLQSHRLFRWAFERVEEVAHILIHAHHRDMVTADLHAESWSEFRQFDL